MLRGHCLNQRDPRLFRSCGIVPYPSPHNKELTRSHKNISAVGRRAANPQLPAQHQKHLVLISMRVPRKLALNTRYLDELIVYLTHDPRRPKLGESTAREIE